MLRIPAVTHCAQHAHGQGSLGVAQAVDGYAIGLGLGLMRLAQDGPRYLESHISEKQDERRGHCCKNGKIGMEKPANRDKDDRPRRFNEGQQRRTGKELAQLHQVAEQLVHVHVFAQGVAAKGRVKYVWTHVPVNTQRQAHHQALADPLHSTPKHVHCHDDERERHQGDAAAAAQDPVIHVQKVEHGRQAQELQHVSQTHHKVKGLLALAQDLAQRRLLRRTRRDFNGQTLGRSLRNWFNAHGLIPR